MIRHTLRNPISLSGIGVRGASDVTVRVLPIIGGTGITVERTDIDACWPADLDHALDVPGCTAIGDEGTRVDFTEHILAALWAVGVTDARIRVDGPEIPLLDGSALPWYREFSKAGTSPVDAFVAPITIKRPIFDIQQDRAIMALPAKQLHIAYSLVHPHPMIGHQFAEYADEQDDFARKLAPARTFATAEELQQLSEAGYIRAGSEANCLVVYGNGFSDEPFAPNAFARHKLVDLIGDLYLVGAPLNMQIVAHRTGHKDNRRLAEKILKQYRSQP